MDDIDKAAALASHIEYCRHRVNHYKAEIQECRMLMGRWEDELRETQAQLAAMKQPDHKSGPAP